MDFALTEEQTEAAELASQILSREAAVDRLKQLEDSGVRFDSGLWDTMAEAGLLGIAISERFGGMGFGFETLCLIAQQVGATVAPVPFVPCMSGALALQHFAAKERCEVILTDVAAGKALLTTAFNEPGRDDPALPTCTIEQRGGEATLSGSKHLVPYGCQANWVLLTAQQEGQLALLLLPTSRDGVEIRSQLTTANEPTGLAEFDGVQLREEDILLTGSEAEHAIEWLVARSLVINCFMLLGVAEAMLALTASYTAEREQFGRAIATFQAVSHRAADAYIDVENLRLVCHQAAALLEHEQSATEAIYIAKIWSCDVAHRVSQSAQHLHGGIGVDKDYPLFRYSQWAKQLELYLGGGHQYLARLGQAIAVDFKQQVA